MADEGAQVSFDLHEIDAVKKMLANAALSGADRAKLLGDIGSEMITQTGERFDLQKSPSGDSWKDLAESTRKYYEKHNLMKGSLLNREGLLMQSLTREVQGGAWSVLVGAAREYAAPHQFGWPEKNIPARPYLGVSADDMKAIENAVAVFLGGLIK